MRFDVRGIDHLRAGGASIPGQLAEQVFPDAALRPAHEAVIDRRRRPILRWAITPAAAGLQHMHDAAGYAEVLRIKLNLHNRGADN